MTTTCDCLVVKVSRSHTGQGSIHCSNVGLPCRMDSLTTRATVLLVLFCSHQWDMGGDPGNHCHRLFCQALPSSGCTGQVTCGTAPNVLQAHKAPLVICLHPLEDAPAHGDVQALLESTSCKVLLIVPLCVQDIMACKPCEICIVCN